MSSAATPNSSVLSGSEKCAMVAVPLAVNTPYVPPPPISIPMPSPDAADSPAPGFSPPNALREYRERVCRAALLLFSCSARNRSPFRAPP
jgi:hypothetical protein